jgi:hypothetical protein
MNTEQAVLDAFERGKGFGFAEGMKSMRLKESQPYPTVKQYADALAEIEYWKSAFERAMEIKK